MVGAVSMIQASMENGVVLPALSCDVLNNDAVDSGRRRAIQKLANSWQLRLSDILLSGVGEWLYRLGSWEMPTRILICRSWADNVE